ncbi:hypothetical protein [Methylotuvimicrobium alcaliphilum]|uniref:Uncharacterized protein n=1 Tax=Methylotuvimicrobium alcaliphilum (strain DSM 19304 / NCIMB 14124 / VKM B-2133 / 20Z) TaxID=1091494 RepID=G4SWA5_META2|nr:hypothetical protein [Methylotuvimicrobium alcaliphilum]CCE23020.1 protein of unknown function [Methylotuvimicrobium alcaliphilum 20Z]
MIHPTIFNPTEAAEKTYLERVKIKLGDALESIDARVRSYAEDTQEQMTYLWENRAEMDHAEKNSTREIVPDASEKNYATEMDKNLLYVACTPAMHELTLTFAGNATTFIPE